MAKKIKARGAGKPRRAVAPAKNRTAGATGNSAAKRRLLKMREDIVRLVKGNQAEELPLTEVGDEADAASRSAERELLFELSDNERNTLDAVEAAIRKIERGGYGTCESCRERIGAPRLQAIPHARYCIGCQARFDKPRP